MPDRNPTESMDAEGLPSLEDRPPGIDVDLDSEGVVVPRDHPIVVGDDPAYGTTAAEQRQTETVQERAARELPDVGAEELNVGGGARHGDASAATGTDDGDAGRFYAPDSGDGIDFDDEPAAVAYAAEGTDDGLTAEEAAVHVTDDLPGAR